MVTSGGRIFMSSTNWLLDELNAFDYEKFKANGFEVERLGDYPLELMDNPNV